ncbi:FprA family A-type flavoprotein [Desulfurivibrio alkaliphilus]|uniref:Flavodoxin/nitric oxide synthase n=1 Tax=Desulfurivibrio alkaliphilus (strain DSM 19089 / UNIQEM U267 / AHT2) TaxID=589865 RepID=D6Z5K3_DESAT|nr:flavodoxin domain-containing protein [Desulfurivibrio alkaliphilus]ADH86740.1 flavodoxin/nitric oxide synthase [Desulfurivibrio alkaliphilus AHT 2]
MKAVEIKPDVFWVGAVDWNNRDFHGYSIKKGTTYNAYLVRDEKTVLFDTVRQGFKSDLLHHLHHVVEPEKIDYLVVNHVELDHSGCLPEMIELIKPEKIFCSPMGQKALLEHFHRPDWPLVVVKSGESISLGKRTVRFLETRMLHWPDSMFSYLPEDKLLISSDAFGQHWATSQRFDDEVDGGELMAHAAKYYANILLPFSPLVDKLLAQVQAEGLEIEMIAPDHGLIWRSNPGAIVEAYQRWCRQESAAKAVIIYDTMWHSTEKMAKAVESGLLAEGINNISLLHARRNHRSDIMAEVLNARALIIGSATLNNNIMPAMADVLTYMKGLRPKNKLGAAFGSYGWSGEAVKHLNGYLEEMGVELVGEGVRIKNVPTHEALADCVELGRAIARAMG